MADYQREYIFEETDAIGRIYELEKINEIKIIYPQTHKFEPEDKSRLFECDIVVPEIGNTIECKADYAGANSVNVCIEVGQDGRVSGLNKTLAGFWLHCDGINDYLTKTNNIKRLIKENYWDEIAKLKTNQGYVPNLHNIRYYSRYPINQGNYTKLMDLYLIPKDFFSEFCLEVKPKGKLSYIDLK